VIGRLVSGAPCTGRRPASNASGPSVAYRHLLTFNNHRDFAAVFAEVEHPLHPRGVLGNVDVGKRCLVLFEMPPGIGGVRSGVLTKDQNLVRHIEPPNLV
jgi:hypothetical protein